jgi:hypothetical protein
MGSVKKREIAGVARDIETIIRLRPWMEDEARNIHGQFSKSKLITDYDSENELFKFKIILEP